MLFPNTDNAPVIRTDFDDQLAWVAICELIRRPVNDTGEDFFAYVDFVDDVKFRDMSNAEILACAPVDFKHTFLFVVDRVATHKLEFPVLVVDLHREPGRTFRTIPSQIQGIENNLSISNMDFCGFADNIDEGGVFRGFG